MFGRKKSRPKDLGLGRIPSFDDRSLNYPVRSMLGAEPLRTKVWRRPRALNQKRTPQCVGYSLWGAYNTSPLTKTYTYDLRNLYTPEDIYNGAQVMDEWPGTDYDGSSVLGGVKWMKSMGLIQEYRWCFTIEDVLQTLSHVGPVVVGTNWFYDMFNAPDPDPGRSASSDYVLSCTGNNAGGHAYELHGINVTDELVIGTNSWGRRWGDEGRMYITWSDMEQLLSDNGEALVIL